MKSNILFLIFFLITGLVYSNNFKPVYHRNLKVGEINKKEYLETRNIQGLVIYNTKIILSKNRYIQGEPIQFKLYAFPQNNKSAVLAQNNYDARFIIKGDDVLYTGTIFKYTGLYLWKAKKDYVILPFPFLKNGGSVKNPTIPVSDSSNVFSYFWNYSNLQYKIKPDKYWIKLEIKEIIRDAYRYTKIDSHTYKTTKIEKGDTIIIKPCSTVVYIDTVPDSEKEAFGLYKAGRYKELISKYPKSVYAAPSYYGIFQNDVQAYREGKGNEIILKKKLMDEFYELVKNYSYYCTGECMNIELIFKRLFMENYYRDKKFSFFSSTAEMETYFKKFDDLKDNEFAQWFYKDIYRGYVDLLKKVMGRYRR